MAMQPAHDGVSAGDTVRTTIRAVMAARRVSGPQLAQMVGVSSQSLYQRLNGKTAITVDDLDTIARALCVPVAVFFTGNLNVIEYAASDSNREPTDSGFWPGGGEPVLDLTLWETLEPAA